MTKVGPTAYIVQSARSLIQECSRMEEIHAIYKLHQIELVRKLSK